jgi:hypothetical protein
MTAIMACRADWVMSTKRTQMDFAKGIWELLLDLILTELVRVIQ